MSYPAIDGEAFCCNPMEPTSMDFYMEIPYDGVSFEEFCGICEELSSTASRNSKIATLTGYLRGLSDEDLEVAARFLVGRIFPKGSDLEVSVGHRTVLNLIAQISGMDESTVLNIYRRYGDMGATAQEALSAGRPKIATLAPPEALTLRGVYAELERAARAVGEGAAQRRESVMRGLMLSCNPLEAKYLVKLLLAELRIGIVEGMMEQAIAGAFGADPEDVKRARLLVGDVGEIALLAKRGQLNSIDVKPLRPLEFMLAEPIASPEVAVEYYGGRALLAEYKYDGVRAQLHVDGEAIRLFSRRLDDITRSFPEVVEGARRLGLRSAILDGEVLGYRDGRPLPFRELQRRLRRSDPWTLADEVPVVYMAYDMMYLDGKQLIDEPLSKRKELLRGALAEAEGALRLSSTWIVSEPQEIRDLFLRSRREGHEGLMLKDLGSRYEVGKRGRRWMKLKVEVDTIDAVVVGAEYGHGKRAGKLSDLIFALWEGDELKVVGKAYTGLTDHEISWITERLGELKVRDEGLRVLVKPEIVVEIAFDSVQRSDRHPGGYALRFPRIKRIRLDKGPEEADRLDRLRELAHIYGGRLG